MGLGETSEQQGHVGSFGARKLGGYSSFAPNRLLGDTQAFTLFDFVFA
jgi:hypothetical protein